jgi:hypothetical protein
MSADKRSVTTDALETLGGVISENEKRDAIHLAVEPIEAGGPLRPGQHAMIQNGKAYACRPGEGVGIADPFLADDVAPGQRFWLVVYPRQITSLRHVWTHPAFENQPEPTAEATDPVSVSKKWIENFAADIDQTYNRLMGAAEDWLYSGEYAYDNTESYKDHWDKFPEFWNHYEVVTGKKVEDKEASFFTCSC